MSTIIIMKYLLLAVALLAVARAQTACSNIPSDNVYYLTSFCDQTTSCGKSCGNCTWGYAADRQRFGCGSVISCTNSGKSINLEVIDYGPDCTLEKKSGKPIIDASYSACKLFTGSTSCGWSDKIPVTCKKIAAPEHKQDIPIGVCTWDKDNVSVELPYCHLPETQEGFGFHNIEEWVHLKEMIVA
jgi:hypothetical protein